MAESNEVLEKVCAVRRKFDDLVKRHSDDTNFTDSVMAALDEAEFLPEDSIREEYRNSADSARLLRIGIVGAVKAGKSSLLNSLFFDGQDILPKAATPMTAALTEITWGEKPSVTVDFFTDQDIEELRRRSDKYESKFKEKLLKKLKEFEDKWREAHPDNPGASEREGWEKSSKLYAETEASKNKQLRDAWDQYQLISKSVTPRKTESETLAVDSVSDISGRLKDYVGAEGRYMPFTSKVLITLPLESLRGIEVVDTPGFNDPVPSRDERARHALRDCDVIFILSRATPFLNKEDMNVISKIKRKNGLREIYIVPSQVDITLTAPEQVSKSDRDMDTAIDNITEILSGVVSKNLRAINDSGVFDQLIREAPDRMFLTSGICESMARTFAERNDWDNGRKKAWQNLCIAYPDFFSDDDEDTSIDSLKRLGNTEKIRASIDDVKKRKDEIFRDRLAKFGSKYALAENDTKERIISDLEAREREIRQKGSLGRMEQRIQQLQQSYDTVGPELDDVFLDNVSEWYDSVQSEYQNRLSSMKDTAKGQIDENIKISKGLFSDSVSVYRSELRSVIDEYVSDYNGFFPHFFNEKVRKLVRKVINGVQNAWDKSGAAGDEPDSGFKNRVRNVISGIAGNYDLKCKSVSYPFGSLKDFIHTPFPIHPPFIAPLPSLRDLFLSRNDDGDKLEGSDAEEFIAQARRAVSVLNLRFKEMMQEAIENLYQKCRSLGFSKSVLAPYIRQLEERKKDMEAPKIALENISRMKEEVEHVSSQTANPALQVKES